MIDWSLLLLSLIWGINNPVIKHALQHFEPLSFNGLCFAIASILLIIMMKARGESFPRFGADWPKVISVGLIGETVYQGLFIMGIHWTRAGNTSLILAAVPAFVAVMFFFTRHETITPLMWGGIIVSFLGVACVVLGSGVSVGLNNDTFRGDLTILIAAMFAALYVVIASPLAKRHDPLGTATATLTYGTIVLFLISIPSLVRQDWKAITWMDWLTLIYSASLATAFAQVLVYRGIKENGGTRMAMYNNLVPLASLVVAWLLLAEVPRLLVILGGIAILLGTFLTGYRTAES